LIFFSCPPPRHPTLPLLPYTTLFRSLEHVDDAPAGHRDALRRAGRPRGVDDVREVVEGDAAARWRFADRVVQLDDRADQPVEQVDRKSTRLNSSHVAISYAVFCLKKK